MKSSKYDHRQLKHLASILHCDKSLISQAIENTPRLYRKKIETKVDKDTQQAKTYADGTVKQRIIEPSEGVVKELQRRINQYIFSEYKFPSHVQGSVKGRSNITNGKIHQGKKYKFCTDFKDFFPSISNKMVFEAFRLMGYTPTISRLLTQLTTYRFKVPQGAPTSSYVANLVALPLDEKLMALCVLNDITYTRYVDDLTFSSSKDFRHLIDQIAALIKEAGFKISYRKTKYSGRQTITGIEVFNNFIDVPDDIKQRVNAEIIQNSHKKGGIVDYFNAVRRVNTKSLKAIRKPRS